MVRPGQLESDGRNSIWPYFSFSYKIFFLLSCIINKLFSPYRSLAQQSMFGRKDTECDVRL